MKKLLVLALGFALMACTNPMTVDTDDAPAVETDAEMMEEAAADETAAVEATEEAMEEVVAE